MSLTNPERVNRKDFFRMTFKKILPDQPKDHTSSSITENLSTRRNFNKVALAVGAGILGLHLTTRTGFAEKLSIDENETPNQEQPDILRQVADTIIATTALETSELVSMLGVLGYEAPIGTATTADEMKLLSRANIEDIWMGGITGAAIELVRWVPNWIFGRGSGDKWGAGIPVSIVSAMLVNSKYVPYEYGGKKPEYFSGGKMPIFPFVDGLLYWKVLRDKGLPYSALAHSWKNIVTLSLGRTVARKSVRLADNFLAPLTEPFAIKDIRSSVIGRIIHSIKG